MNTAIDTSIPQQNRFPFTSTQATATAGLAETGQVTVHGTVASRTMQFLVAPQGAGLVFTQDTEGSISVSKP